MQVRFKSGRTIEVDDRIVILNPEMEGRAEHLHCFWPIGKGPDYMTFEEAVEDESVPGPFAFFKRYSDIWGIHEWAIGENVDDPEQDHWRGMEYKERIAKKYPEHYGSVQDGDYDDPQPGISVTCFGY